MKRGFSLIIAMIFILIIATIGILSLSISTVQSKKTTDDFLKEQAILIAQSATEYSVMAMQAHFYSDTELDVKRGTNCLENITLFYPSNDEKR